MDHRPYRSTGLPCPSGSTLVSRRSACATDFLLLPYLHAFSYIRLCLSFVLSPTGYCLTGSAWVSNSPGSTSGGWISDSTLAPPTIGSTMGLHHNCASGRHLDPSSIIPAVVFPSAGSYQFQSVSSSTSSSRNPDLLPFHPQCQQFGSAKRHFFCSVLSRLVSSLSFHCHFFTLVLVIN